jgi:hypothetical protein
VKAVAARTSAALALGRTPMIFLIGYPPNRAVYPLNLCRGPRDVLGVLLKAVEIS